MDGSSSSRVSSLGRIPTVPSGSRTETCSSTSTCSTQPRATVIFFHTKRKYSHYLIRAEYKFTAEKSAQGFAGWTNQNNGLLLHSQDPSTIPLGVPFPNSIEVQSLGPKNTNEAAMVPSVDWPVGHTVNLCTPQSFLSWKGTADYKVHCTASKYPEAW